MTDPDSDRFDRVLRAVAASPEVKQPRKKMLGERFLLHRRLGEGGFGVVYEAEDLRDGGRVALKLLRHGEADWLYRFKREFRAIQGLTHPSLVVLDELFCDDDRWFFTMELVDGKNFVEHVRALPAGDRARSSPVASFDEQRLRDGLALLFEGLAVLHGSDKVHRDIKPANVLVTRAGRVVLIDFGLVTDSFSGTASATVGTPAYMAPEQAASQRVGPAADMYAVGVMLYQILTGRLPLDGPSLQLLIDKQTQQPPSPASVAPGVSEELDVLCMKLLRVDAARRPTAEQVWRSLTANRAERPPAGEHSSTNGSMFVGRGTELHQLRAAFDSSTRGELSMVLVSGESGIGKSHLVRRFAKLLLAEHPEIMLLEGRCHEREAMPYKTLDGIVDALSRYLSRMPPGEVAAVLPTQRAMLARLFPVMLRVPLLAREYAKTESNVEPQETRQRGFSALRELFARIALGRPTVIAIDDLQWADEDGLKALAEILRTPDAPPLLFIGTVRVGRGHVDATLARLRAQIPGRLAGIELTSLGQEDAHELASRLLRQAGASSADPVRIANEAGGHPLFVEELARQAALGGSIGGSVKLDDAIWSRVVQLDGLARNLAELVAVAGKPLPQQVAAAAARLEPGEFQRHAAILRASNLVRTSGARWEDSIEPYHDRVLEAVVARLEPSRRSALHEALAIALEASSHTDPETLTVHWREAGNASRAANYARVAGDQALAMFAFDRAASWFEQSLSLLPDGRDERRSLRIKLGEALALAGRGALAAPHFEQAAVDSPAFEALELRRRAAEQLLRSGHFDSGMQASHLVLASIGMSIPATPLRAFVLFILYSVLLRLRGLKFRERAPGQISAEERMRIDACWSVGLSLTFVETFTGVILIRRALLLALAAGDLERVVRALGMIAGSSGATGSSWRRTRQLVRHTRELAERSGSVEARAFATVAAGASFYLNGDFLEAQANLVRALEAFQHRSTGLAHERVSVRMFLIWSLGWLGRFAELRQCQAEGLRDARARGDLYAEVNFTVGLSNLAWLIEDRPDLAEIEINAAMEQWSKQGFHLEHHFAIHGTISAKLYAGEIESAHALAGELMRRTKASLLWRLRSIRLLTLSVRGGAALAMLERGLGPRNALLAEVARDARGIEKDCLPWMQALALTLRAGIALYTGVPERALTALDEAAQQFAAHDLNAHAAAARDRAARLRADASSAAEIARTEEWMKSEGVVRPDRMIAMLLPGLLTRGSVARPARDRGAGNDMAGVGARVGINRDGTVDGGVVMRALIALVLFSSALTGCGVQHHEFAAASGSGGTGGSGAFAGASSAIQNQAAGGAGRADGSDGHSAGAGGSDAGAGGSDAGAGGSDAGAGGSDAGAGGAGEIAGAGGADKCVSNATQCAGIIPRICDDQGRWVTGSVTVGLCGVSCKPGNVSCAVNDLEVCQSDGTWQATTCANGCLDAQCRDSKYGTVGVAGTFTCNVLPHPISCSTGNICCYSPSAGTATCTTSCVQGADSDNVQIMCDGPNDCVTGQVCCYEDVGGSYVSTKCETAACPPPGPASSSSLVCDPSGVACSKGICKLYAGGSKRLGAPLYTCQ